jgi:hypothetical protein
MAASNLPAAQFAPTVQDSAFVPAVPESVNDLGIPRSMLEQIVLKTLYFRGDLTGRLLANALGVNYSVIEPIISHLKRQHQLVVRAGRGPGGPHAPN